MATKNSASTTKKTSTKAATKSPGATSRAKSQTAARAQPAKSPANRAAKSPTKAPAASQTRVSPAAKAAHHRHQVMAVVLFGVAVLMLAVIIFEGQSAWKMLHNALLGVFGIAVYIVPFLLMYIAVRATLNPGMGSIGGKILQCMLLVGVLSGIIQTMFIGEFAGANLLDICTNLFKSGQIRHSGGVISMVFGLPLMKLCGRTGASIIFAIVLFVLVLIVTGVTIVDAFKLFVSPFKRTGERYMELRNVRELARENALLDEDEEMLEEPMPQHPVSAKKPVQIAPVHGAPVHIAQSGYESAIEKELDLTFEKPEPVKAPVAEQSEIEKAQERKKLPEKVRKKSKNDEDEELPEIPPLLDDLVKKAVPEVAQTISSQTPATQILPVEEKLEKLLDDSEKKAAENLQKAPIKPEFPSEFKPIASVQQLEIYKYPPVSLLKAPVNRVNNDLTEELKMNAELLVNTLKSFGVQTRVIDISRGPTVTRYELQPSAGVKISKITGLSDDIALNLATAGVRIEAPIPNKAAVGIEVPNKVTSIVTIKEIIDSKAFRSAKSKLSVALGRDISGNEVVFDIGKMPHMLIAGATGSGKSVCINALIMSVLYKSTPDDVRLLMIDPKVVELGIYNGIPHLLVPVVTDPRKAAGALGWAVTEMLNRYKLFADSQVRDLTSYNELAMTKEDMDPLPQIVIIIDELADLMMAAPNEVEDAICRLAQMARAAGMHLVIATQRPSVDVITGVIKANIPSRIAFSVSSQVDSRTIIDSGGAEKLLGRGDMLFYPVGAPKPTRLQCCYVSDKEVEAVVSFVKNSANSDYDDKIIDEIEKQAVKEKGSKGKEKDSGGGFDDEDALLPQAIEAVVEAGQASTSYLQRKLKVGYARAARLVDDMESKGIVGELEGSKPRPVLITRNQWIEMKMNANEEK